VAPPDLEGGGREGSDLAWQALRRWLGPATLVDIVSERSWEAFASRLAAHPGAELIAGTAPVFISSAERGVLGAMQGADQWHL